MEAVREEYVTLQLHDAQLERIEALMERNMARQEAIASDIKGELKAINARIGSLDTKIDGVEKKKLDAKIESVEQKLDAKIESVKNELNARIDNLDEKIDSVEKKLDAKIESVRSELSAKIDGVEQRLETKIDGVMDSIAITNSRIDDLNSKKSNSIALWAIAAAVGICAFQAIVSLISLLR